MNKVFVTADHHFGHKNILKYQNRSRPFDSVDEMDAVMIDRWNEMVSDDDVVFHLGDFTLGDNIKKYISQLKGVINVVPGGHDWRWMNKWDGLYPPYTTEPIYNYRLENTKLIVVMCHYPMREWDRSHYGAFHLYGHVHGNLPGIGRSMDVGVDTNNFYPYLLDDVISELEKIEPHNAPKIIDQNKGIYS